jgi:DNA (cytosine-5)-methyltransferase 1
MGSEGGSMKLKTLDLFAGAGGFTLAGEMAGGYETVAFCEIDKYAQKVLQKNWPSVTIFNDVTKLKGSDVGPIDVITGGVSMPRPQCSRSRRWNWRRH